jgi:hypothetical protein
MRGPCLKNKNMSKWNSFKNVLILKAKYFQNITVFCSGKTKDYKTINLKSLNFLRVWTPSLFIVPRSYTGDLCLK